MINFIAIQIIKFESFKNIVRKEKNECFECTKLRFKISANYSCHYF